MEFDKVKELSQRYLFPNYGRLDLAFERGEGCYLYDDEGKQYLDTVAGIAVCSLGYSHPEWVKAMRDQVSHLVHVSNLYYIKEQAQLAQRISTITPEPITRTLFCNSGAEANEGAMKTAVRYTGRTKIMSALNGFHGRTSAAMGATGQKNIQNSFEALINKDAYVYYTFNDLEDVKAKMTKDTAALIIEGIQGESGVHSATREFFRGVRDLCTDNGTLMIVDEVQSGMGRTGTWFAWQGCDVKPALFTCAKALGGGLPMGALVSNAKLADVLVAPSHASTFGGNPVAAAAALAVIEVIESEGLLAKATEIGNLLREALQSFVDKYDKVLEVRGKGLMLGLVVDADAGEVVEALQAQGVLALTAGSNVVRFLPPLVLKAETLEDEVVDMISDALDCVFGE